MVERGPESVRLMNEIVPLQHIELGWMQGLVVNTKQQLDRFAEIYQDIVRDNMMQQGELAKLKKEVASLKGECMPIFSLNYSVI